MLQPYLRLNSYPMNQIYNWIFHLHPVENRLPFKDLYNYYIIVLGICLLNPLTCAIIRMLKSTSKQNSFFLPNKQSWGLATSCDCYCGHIGSGLLFYPCLLHTRNNTTFTKKTDATGDKINDCVNRCEKKKKNCISKTTFTARYCNATGKYIVYIECLAMDGFNIILHILQPLI